jgi:hypothetical protein
MSTEEILKHMEQRYRTGNTDIQPDAATYNWSSHRLGEIKDHDAADRAEKSSVGWKNSSRRWKSQTKRNQLTFTSMFWPESNDPLASERAMKPSIR